MTASGGDLVRRLIEARRGGTHIASLPPGCVPADAAAAYAVQEAVAATLGRIVGWKVGAGPGDVLECAPLLADLVAESPARFAAARFPLGGIEGELAFRFGRDLPARAQPYDAEEVWQAIDTLHPAIELIESRFVDFRAHDRLVLLADNLANGAFCHGPGVRDWRHVDFLAQPASLVIDGAEVACAMGGNAAGHPKRLLAWLANHCARRGRALAAGDVVTTGSHTGLVFAKPGATATVRFAGVGEARLTLTA
ncbi:MAG TPA: fumarylacetoacetate hydrolase family protein [Stellaceae bacterium]|nr:fumarylacetoacetate hydrolase family protein [Stellaceae bacterium]